VLHFRTACIKCSRVDNRITLPPIRPDWLTLDPWLKSSLPPCSAAPNLIWNYQVTRSTPSLRKSSWHPEHMLHTTSCNTSLLFVYFSTILVPFTNAIIHPSQRLPPFHFKSFPINPRSIYSGFIFDGFWVLCCATWDSCNATFWGSSFVAACVTSNRWLQ
jgi:hypothetical protein